MTTLRVEKKENPVRSTGYGTVVRVKASIHADAPYKSHCGCEWWSARYVIEEYAMDALIHHWWTKHCPITWFGFARFWSE